MTKIIVPPSSPLPEHRGPNPFRFGWRYVTRRQPDGTEEYVQVPLTPEDLLHPQEGDEMVENTVQERDCRYLHDVLEQRLADRPAVLSLSDCLVNWGVPGLGNHSPDISVFEGVRDRDRLRKTFPMAQEGARPLFVIEVVSPDDYDPRVRNSDIVTKVEHYHRAGVPLYIIVDQEGEDGPRRLIDYRYTPEGYVEVPLDEQGRLLLEPVGVYLQLRDNRVVCYDAVTGQEMPDYVGQGQGWQSERAARERAEQQAAEERARAQAAAAALQAETEARQRAEERIRALEAELQRRRGNGQEPARDG